MVKKRCKIESNKWICRMEEEAPEKRREWTGGIQECSNIATSKGKKKTNWKRGLVQEFREEEKRLL